jgi:hypothetical protein
MVNLRRVYCSLYGNSVELFYCKIKILSEEINIQL